MRTCEFHLCKKGFEPNRKDQIFCTKSCRMKSYYYCDKEKYLEKARVRDAAKRLVVIKPRFRLDAWNQNNPMVNEMLLRD